MYFDVREKLNTDQGMFMILSSNLLIELILFSSETFLNEL